MKDDLDSSDDRSPLAKALDKGTEVFTACLMMVLPGIGGYYVDQYLNTLVTFTILGFLFGLAAGIWQILKIIKPQNSKSTNAR